MDIHCANCAENREDSPGAGAVGVAVIVQRQSEVLQNSSSTEFYGGFLQCFHCVFRTPPIWTPSHCFLGSFGRRGLGMHN